MSSARRTRAIAIGAVYAGLVASAHIDLTRRDAARIKGPKTLWRIVTLTPFVGPILYFLAGRKR